MSQCGGSGASRQCHSPVLLMSSIPSVPVPNGHCLTRITSVFWASSTGIETGFSVLGTSVVRGRLGTSKAICSLFAIAQLSRGTGRSLTWTRVLQCMCAVRSGLSKHSHTGLRSCSIQRHRRVDQQAGSYNIATNAQEMGCS